MPKLYVENGPDRGKSYVITGEGPFFAGRDPAAQVPLLDEMASRRHFQVEFRNNVYHVRDLGSSNGTLLNGRMIKDVAPLSPNDRIEVGETRITFVDERKPTLIGSEIAGYRILDRVGRGGMGTVYRATQISLDRVVAMKILAPHLTEKTDFVNLFIREARAAGALSHPNIVQVYDVGVERDTYFFSMEYVPNGSVEDILNASGALPLARCLKVVRDSAQGLVYAEERGIIHRDIKPGNLIVSGEGVIKIGDLGIARSTEGAGSVSQKDGVSGSPHYIAPEQARGQEIDHRVDLYSLGVSFYQMLCGKTPFSGKTPREVILKHIKEDPPRITERLPDVPDDVAKLVHRMMAKDRDHRPASAAQLLREMEPLLERYRDEDEPPGIPAGGGLAKRVALIGIGAVVLVGVGIGGVIARKNYNDELARQERVAEEYDTQQQKVADQIALGDFDAASKALAELDALAPPSDEEKDESKALATELSEKIATRAREERRGEATVSLDSVLASIPRHEGDARVTYFSRADEAKNALERWFEEYPDTELRDLAERAREARSDLERDRKANERLWSSLDSKLAQYREQIQIYLGKREYRLASKELEKFEEANRFGKFAEEWNRLERECRDTVTRDWAGIEVEVREQLQARNFSGADGNIDFFLRKTEGYPAEVREPIEAMARELERARNTQAPPDEDTDPSRAVARDVLRDTWERWMTDTTRVGRNAIGDPARDQRRALGDHRAAIDAHIDFLEEWSKILDGMADSPPDDLEYRLDGRTLEVKTIYVDDAEILVRIDGGGWKRLAFEEFSPRSQLALIFRRWARTPQERLYCGFLAHVAGNSSIGTKLWSDLGADFAAPLAELREILILGGVLEGDD